MEMETIGSPAGTLPAGRNAQPDTEPEEEQDAALEQRMAVIDAAVNADEFACATTATQIHTHLR